MSRSLQRPVQRHTPGRVLLVGLDSVTSRVICRAAQGQGCALEVTGSLDEALRSCRGRRFQLIIIDMDHSDAGGFEVVVAMRGTPGNLAAKVIALGGPVLLSATAETSAAGFDRVLIKPADVRELESLCSCLAKVDDEVLS